MHQIPIQLTERLYEEAERRAGNGGFRSVDEYVADVVRNDLHDAPENFDHLFTPEVIAKLDAAAAQADAGQLVTFEELEARLNVKRGTWHTA